MIRELPTRVIAGCFALVAFALAIVVGLASGASFNDVVSRALLVILACFIVGASVASAAKVAVVEHLKAYAEKRERELDEIKQGIGGAGIHSVDQGVPEEAQSQAKAA